MKNRICLICIALLGLLLNAACDKGYGYLFEQGYNSGDYEDSVTMEVDTNRFKIDYSKYNQARLFPGLIGEKEPRMEDVIVNVDLNYEDIKSADLRISVAPGNWQSTGYYAPAGELIVIEVPVGVYGLTGQIGAHIASSAAGIEFPQRDLKITKNQVLFPGKNYMRNLYGGLIYILPTSPLGRIVELRFSGVAKAPSFKLGETTNEEWAEMVAKSTVPWFELEGKRIVFTLETSKLSSYAIDDPTLLMTTWDDMIRRGFWDWTGMTEGNPDIRHRAPFNKWRIVHDVLFKKDVAQVSGYPVRAMNTKNYFRQAVDVNAVKYSNWGTYHELGHNMQMGSTWSFGGNGEVSNNLFSFQVSKLNGRQNYKIADVWPKAIPYLNANKDKEVEASKINWESMDLAGNPYKSASLDIRLIMYAQLFEKYGYNFMTYLCRRAREARFKAINNQARIDFFYESISEFVKTDMELFFNVGWGIYPSALAKKNIAEKKGLPPLTRNVWLYNPVTNTGGDELYIDLDRVVLLSRTNWSATASNYQNNSNYVPSKTLDGDVKTDWRACWNSTCVGGNFKNPTWIMNLVTGPTTVGASGLFFQQRQVENSNNHIKLVQLEVSTDNKNWKNLGIRSLTRSLKPQYLFFDESSLSKIENVRYVRLTINRADLYNTADYPAIAELGLFTYNK